MSAKIPSGQRLTRNTALSLSLAAITTAVEVVAGIKEDNPVKVAGACGGLVGGLIGDVITGVVTGAVLGIETGPLAIVTGLIGGIVFGVLGQKAAEQHLSGAVRYLMGASKEITQPAAPLAAEPTVAQAAPQIAGLPEQDEIKSPQKPPKLYVVQRREHIHPEDVTTPIRSHTVRRHDVPTRTNFYRMAV
ncbi:MAG: hypothetical protein PHY92_01915 [Alphaproteobacteria bacterium]|nr:hypothetical protein [Alphaproteobacteria bacterium]